MTSNNSKQAIYSAARSLEPLAKIDKFHKLSGNNDETLLEFLRLLPLCGAENLPFLNFFQLPDEIFDPLCNIDNFANTILNYQLQYGSHTESFYRA